VRWRTRRGRARPGGRKDWGSRPGPRGRALDGRAVNRRKGVPLFIEPVTIRGGDPFRSRDEPGGWGEPKRVRATGTGSSST